MKTFNQNAGKNTPVCAAAEIQRRCSQSSRVERRYLTAAKLVFSQRISLRRAAKQQIASGALAAADVEGLEATRPRVSNEAALAEAPVATEQETASRTSNGTTSAEQGEPQAQAPLRRSFSSQDGGPDGRRRPQRQQSNNKRRRGPITDFPFKVGDTFLGRVVYGKNGWRVAFQDHPDILGFCMTNDLPHILRNSVTEPKWSESKVGLLREFRIKSIPEDMEYNGKGPLVTARALDLDVIWQRAAQILEICKEDYECIEVSIKTINAGGLLGSFEGLPVFVPYSFIPSTRNCSKPEREELVKQFLGTNVSVCICDMDRKNNRFIGNLLKALQIKAFNKLQVGDLVWGRVDGLEPYGAFIDLDGYPSISGLLHIKAISRSLVNDIQDVLHVGEKVLCLVDGVDATTQRVSLSTAEIEGEAGDMLFNKAKVFENAEENVKDFREWAAARQLEIDAGEASYDDDADNLQWNE